MIGDRPAAFLADVADAETRRSAAERPDASDLFDRRDRLSNCEPVFLDLVVIEVGRPQSDLNVDRKRYGACRKGEDFSVNPAG